MILFTNASEYSDTDTVMVTSQLLDNQMGIDSAKVTLDVFTENRFLGSFQMLNIQNGMYNYSLPIWDIIMENVGLDSISSNWNLLSYVEYEGTTVYDSALISVNVPDLNISGLYFIPDKPFDDEFLLITIGIKNLGNAVSDSTTLFVYDGAIVDSSKIGGGIGVDRLMPGEEEYKSFYIYLGGMQGDHKIIAVIDPDTDVPDCNRLNNEKEENLHVFGRVSGVDDNRNLPPKSYRLLQNYPNPFNPITTIQFDLPEETQTHLDIYSVEGKLVKTLISRKLAANHYKISWDGTDLRGKKVASGVYFLRLKTKKKVLVKKLVILR